MCARSTWMRARNEIVFRQTQCHTGGGLTPRLSPFLHIVCAPQIIPAFTYALYTHMQDASTSCPGHSCPGLGDSHLCFGYTGIDPFHKVLALKTCPAKVPSMLGRIDMPRQANRHAQTSELYEMAHQQVQHKSELFGFL